MVHVFFPPKRNALLRSQTLLALLWLASMLLLFVPSLSFAENGQNKIIAITGTKTAGATELRISTESEPTYTVYELFNPARIVVDMAETILPETTQPNISDGLGITLDQEAIEDITPPLLRLIVTLEQSATFEAKQDANDVILMIKGAVEDQTATTISGSTIEDVKVERL